ncbi:MAG: NUDIX domain-containing protein [Planctomycetaceae bacterium]|nr:NUDIX domain-containing protein [Planctomycetales bacterium]MCB9921124.1 NUDIX domain-containing protein [Planctomycetaceae bacterium]
MTSPIIPFNQTTAIDQACAIPFRSVARQLEFCLITSSSGRWLFPKGFIDPGETFVEAALKEAAEEAGVHGRVLGDPVGWYKIKKNGAMRTVIALLMEVTHFDDTWKESHCRERRWAKMSEAKRLLSKPELRSLLASSNSRLRAA